MPVLKRIVAFSTLSCFQQIYADSLKHAQSYSNTIFLLDVHQSQEEMKMSKSIAFCKIHLVYEKRPIYN